MATETRPDWLDGDTGTLAQRATDDEIASATEAADQACREFLNSGGFPPAERLALADTSRRAINHLRDINGGQATHLSGHP